jgi:ankyrin repeat protein
VTRHIILLVFLVTTLLLGAACSRGGGTVQHGELSYNLEEVFKDDQATALLAKAAGRGDLAEINRLVSKGISVNAFGRNEITPLWWAAWAENYTGFNALLEKGANPNAERSAGLPIMHLVAQLPDSRFLEAALKHGGNPNTIDRASKDTPLFRTVLLHFQDHTALLLTAGANVNAQNPISGWTLPMQAIGSNGDYKLVYELLQRGADWSLSTKDGKSLADIMGIASIDPHGDQYLWREKTMEYLRSKGVKVQTPTHETKRK